MPLMVYSPPWAAEHLCVLVSTAILWLRQTSFVLGLWRSRDSPSFSLTDRDERARINVGYVRNRLPGQSILSCRPVAAALRTRLVLNFSDMPTRTLCLSPYARRNALF